VTARDVINAIGEQAHMVAAEEAAASLAVLEPLTAVCQ